MGVRDRLAGISKKNTFAEFHLVDYVGVKGAHVEWITHQPSPQAQFFGSAQFGQERQTLFDRMYLALILYGTILRYLHNAPEDRKQIFAWVSMIGLHLKERELEHEDIRSVKEFLIGKSYASILYHGRSILYRGRGGNLLNRDYLITTPPNLRYLNPWSSLSAVVSLIPELNKKEIEFFADWILGMRQFYSDHGVDFMASEVPATVAGMNHAVNEAVNRQAANWGITVPDFL